MSTPTDMRAGPLIVVVGPTAAGKSNLAVRIAQSLDGEVVSADAFQVYRGLDIGTAKVDEAEAGGVPHHCIDIADPDEHYTAGRYAREAAVQIGAIRKRGRRVVIAGGSGFYIRALIDGLAPLPRHDAGWRRTLEALEARRGPEHMFAMLEALDAEWASAVGPADRQRILRGLEVTLRLGRPISEVLAESGWSGPHYDAVWIGLTRPRPELYERIEGRVDGMLAAGWPQEVEGLLAGGLAASAPGLRAIGYRELVAHLAGDLTLAEARDEIVRATRRYAKRQLTWFRGQTPAVWFESTGAGADDPGRLFDAVRSHLVERTRANLESTPNGTDHAN